MKNRSAPPLWTNLAIESVAPALNAGGTRRLYFGGSTDSPHEASRAAKPAKVAESAKNLNSVERLAR